jgi:hypothetical protein
MDQDFHYTGTFYAGRAANYDTESAGLIAHAANYIDFMSEANYAGYWSIVENIHGTKYKLDDLTYPRYTFQGGLFGTGTSPEDGLWQSYHFTPGNKRIDGIVPLHTLYNDVTRQIIGDHEIREEANSKYGETHGKMLNRPNSPISRSLAADAIRLCTDDTYLNNMLDRMRGGYLVKNDPNLKRKFKLIQLGVRAHVIADTWAHQDFAGFSHEMNTYKDIDGKWGRQEIKVGSQPNSLNKKLLTSRQSSVFQAVPNGTSYLGHGWMGHLPDCGYLIYKYRPLWKGQACEEHIRDNPTEYNKAWFQLLSLFKSCNGTAELTQDEVNKHKRSITRAITHVPDKYDSAKARETVAKSSNAWMEHMSPQFGLPPIIIKGDKEPDDAMVMKGVMSKPSSVQQTRYGTYVVDASSDIYMFQMAADYHFQYVREFMRRYMEVRFTGTWSKQVGLVSPRIRDVATDNLMKNR